MKKMRITLSGETAEIMERLCGVTGLTPPSLIALLLRKSSRELESWVSSPIGPPPLGNQTISPASTPVPVTPPPPPLAAPLQRPEVPLELPTDKGEGLKPIEF